MSEFDAKPEDPCADCPHQASEHYLRSGKYTDCAWCPCAGFKKKKSDEEASGSR